MPARRMLRTSSSAEREENGEATEDELRSESNRREMTEAKNCMIRSVIARLGWVRLALLDL